MLFLYYFRTGGLPPRRKAVRCPRVLWRFIKNGVKLTMNGVGALPKRFMRLWRPRVATPIKSTCQFPVIRNFYSRVVLFAFFQDRATFRRLIVKNNAKKRRMYETFIESVPLLKSLEVSSVFCWFVAELFTSNRI